MNAAMTQAQVLEAVPFCGDERAAFFCADRFGDLDCLTATFRTHAYPPHTHDTYVIGNIESGCEMWQARGRRHYAGPGDLAFNNPLDVHDGVPWDGGYAYRMTYPSVELMQTIASEVSGHPVTGTPFFPEPVVHDPEGAALFAAAHRAIETGADPLAGEEMLTRAYARVLVRYAQIDLLSIGREHGAIKRVREIIEERFDTNLRLDELARVAGLSRHHLIRAFRHEVGLTPHAYVIDVRVRRAQERLRSGESPASVATAVGFADQAHLTRAFKARLAVAPGAYRRAVGT